MWRLGNSEHRKETAYRSALDGASECIFMIDRKRNIVDANAACGRLFAWPAAFFACMSIDRLITDVVDPAAAEATSVDELFSGDDRTGVLVIAQSIEGRRFRARIRVVTVTGNRNISRVVYLREARDEPVLSVNGHDEVKRC